MTCCVYFIPQVLVGSSWVTLPFSSKDVNETNVFLQSYLQSNGYKPSRILQRSIEKDRQKGLRVPRCC
jgi:hypothetical protein